MTKRKPSGTHHRRSAPQGARDCVFCDIVARGGPASIVYEDGRIMGLMDSGPVNPGHVLVIPKEHRPNLSDLDEETGVHVFRIALRLDQAVRRSGVTCEGINLFLADDEAAFRGIPPRPLAYRPPLQGRCLQNHRRLGPSEQDRSGPHRGADPGGLLLPLGFRGLNPTADGGSASLPVGPGAPCRPGIFGQGRRTRRRGPRGWRTPPPRAGGPGSRGRAAGGGRRGPG